MEHVDFTQPWPNSDIIFVIDENKIHANKMILSMWSPVMSAMFKDDFKEKTQKEIKLPGKNYEDFLELMQVVHPPNKTVNESNVYRMLPLTDEYQMTKLLEHCECYLLSQPPSVKSLVFADKYNLAQLKEKCINSAKTTRLFQLKSQPEYEQINPTILIDILTYKVEVAEGTVQLKKKRPFYYP